MTKIFDEGGRYVPVTLIEAGPCYVLQVKTKATDGYDAIQVGLGEKKAKHATLPEQGHAKKAGTAIPRFVRELKVKDAAGYKPGQKIEADLFAKGDFVDVTGTSIGRGFQGGMKRWGWSGGDAGHGSMFHRAVGSIQSGARLGRVTKGHHLPGHMGNVRITIQNLEVIDVDKENNLIAVKGAVPGHEDGLLIVKEAKKRPKGFVKRKAPPPVSKKSVKAQAGAKK